MSGRIGGSTAGGGSWLMEQINPVPYLDAGVAAPNMGPFPIAGAGGLAGGHVAAALPGAHPPAGAGLAMVPYRAPAAAAAAGLDEPSRDHPPKNPAGPGLTWKWCNVVRNWVSVDLPPKVLNSKKTTLISSISYSSPFMFC